MVIKPTHVGAVLLQILIFFLISFLVHQLVNEKLDNIKMHGTTVKITQYIVPINVQVNKINKM